MSEGLLLIANPGAEEETAPAAAAEPAQRSAVQLWRGLFAADAVLAEGGPVAPDEPGYWPAVLGPRAVEPIFDWLGDPGEATAWLVTEAAAECARAAGRRLRGPSPESVRRVHDKAWALQTARAEGLGDPELLAAIAVFDPDELLDARAVAQRIDATMAAWPDWLRGPEGTLRATLKPRQGSSSRGRVALAAGSDAAIAGALPRLAAQGGALLEPWLSRRADLSAVLRVDPQGGILLLGTLASITTPAGGVRGHRGTFDTKARVTSDSRFDEPLRESAVEMARAAAAAGYHGPCGVDAFVYTGPDGEERLRPVVEFNARFTLGHPVIGWIRRLRVWLKRELAMGPDQRPRRFQLQLAASATGEPPTGGLRLPFAPPEQGPGPVLVAEAVQGAAAGPVQAGLEGDR